MNTASKVFVLLLIATPLAGCSTMNLPNAEFLKLTEFRETVDGLDDGYPQAENMPGAPTRVRSAREWDSAAQALDDLGDALMVPEANEGLTPAEFDREFQKMQDFAAEYREDDPK